MFVKCSDEFEIKNYKEFPGKGIKGFVGENEYKIGMLEFVMACDNKEDTENKASKVYVSRNHYTGKKC